MHSPLFVLALTPVLCLIPSLGPRLGGAPSEETPLLENTGFEEELEGWSQVVFDTDTMFEVDKKAKKKGKRGLRITRGTAGRPAFLKQSGELTTDEGEVEFSVAYRVEDPGHARVTGYFFDEAGETLGGQQELVSSGPTRRKWKAADRKLSVPEGATGFGVNVWVATAGEVLLDDLVAVHVTQGKSKSGKSRSGKTKPAPSMTLVDGGFDRGVEGWVPDKERSGDAELRHDKSRGGERKGSLALKRDGAAAFPLDAWRLRVPRAKREKKARLSWVARVDGSGQALVACQAFGENGDLLASARAVLAACEPFEDGELVLELPRGAAHVDVVVGVLGNVEAWFDDLELSGR